MSLYFAAKEERKKGNRELADRLKAAGNEVTPDPHRLSKVER